MVHLPLKKGHRYSTDDMLTAWVAHKVAGDVDLQIDIGAGIGSCGLMTLWRRSASSKLVMIEAQKSVTNWRNEPFNTIN